MTLASILPTTNAILNATSAVLLFAGWRAIRAGRRATHRKLMLAACGSSVLFLAGYLTRMLLTGTHRFPGDGPLRAAYLVILASHTVLAAATLPLVLRTLQLSLGARFAEHRRIARWTFPVWIYVSLTGVVVYVLLYQVARADEGTARPTAAAPAADYDAIVGAPDRLDADRALDAGRRPAELLRFLAVRPGMRVAEIAAADGYTAELLARAVGPTGTVYAQNPRSFVAFVGDAWPRRLARPVMRRVVRVDREMDDPLPPEARRLDLVVMNAVYHDTVWLRTDRGRMSRALFDALAPGGALVVVDHSAKPGMSLDEAAYELHRIPEPVVRREVEAAGFRLAATSDFLRNPADTRDWNAAPNEAGHRRGTSDRFALRFVKP